MVESSKILLTLLHIILCLIRTFVKGMDKTGAGFIYRIKNFSRKSDIKVKEGVFIGVPR